MEKLKDLNLYVSPDGGIYRLRKMIAANGDIIEAPPQKIPTHVIGNRLIIFNNKKRIDALNLILDHFSPKPNPSAKAAPLDGDLENTHPSNLYWKEKWVQSPVYVYDVPMSLRPHEKFSHRSVKQEPDLDIKFTHDVQIASQGEDTTQVRLVDVFFGGVKEAVRKLETPKHTIHQRLDYPKQKGFVRGYFISKEPDIEVIRQLFAPPTTIFSYEIDDDDLTGFHVTAYHSLEEATSDPNVEADAINIQRCVHTRTGITSKRFWSYERLTSEQLLSSLNKCAVYIYSWPELRLMDAYDTVAAGARDKDISAVHVYRTYRTFNLSGGLFWSENMLTPSEKAKIRLLMVESKPKYKAGVYEYHYPSRQPTGRGPYTNLKDASDSTGLSYSAIQRCVNRVTRMCVDPKTEERYVFSYGPLKD